MTMGGSKVLLKGTLLIQWNFQIYKGGNNSDKVFIFFILKLFSNQNRMNILDCLHPDTSLVSESTKLSHFDQMSYDIR